MRGAEICASAGVRPVFILYTIAWLLGISETRVPLAMRRYCPLDPWMLCFGNCWTLEVIILGLLEFKGWCDNTVTSLT